MTSNQVTTNEFSYSLLSKETERKLKEYDRQLSSLYNNYTIEVGQILYKAQQEFANPKDGTFIKWVEYKGFKRSNAYNYIDIYKAFQNLESSSEKEVFLKQPKSLQIEMSKPSARESLNKRVFDGDITTHKEYKERERIIKEQEQRIKELENRPSEVIEKIVEVEKEVVHPHVEDLRSDNKQLSEALKKEQTKSSNLSWELEELTKRNEFIEKNYNSLIEQRADVDEKSEKYDQLTEAIQNAKGDLDSQQKLIADYKTILKVIKQGNELLLKVSGVAYLEISDVVNNNKIVSREFDSLINGLERLVRDLRSMKGHNIIEGEIINE